jgi:hypothetical protein
MMRSYSSLLEALDKAMHSLVSLLSAEVRFFGHDLPLLAEAARLGERPVAETLRFLGKLANSEVRLLLAGAPLAEGYALDLRYRLMGAGVLRLASHLASPALLCRCFDQENLPYLMGQSVVGSRE